MNPLTLALVTAATLAAAPPPKPAARDPIILFWWHTRPALVKPDGTGVEKLPPFSDHKDPGIGYTRFSPDGRRILTTTDVEDGPGKTRYDLFVRDPHAEGTGDRIGTSPHPWATLFWTPDGAAVIGTEQDAPPAAKAPAPKEVKWVTTRIDLRTNRRTPVAIPAGVFLADVSADGKTFLAARWTDKRSEAGLVPADKPAEFTPLTDGTELVRALRLSPDGRRALVCRSSGGRAGRPPVGLTRHRRGRQAADPRGVHRQHLHLPATAGGVVAGRQADRVCPDRTCAGRAGRQMGLSAHRLQRRRLRREDDPPVEGPDHVGRLAVTAALPGDGDLYNTGASIPSAPHVHRETLR